MSASIVLVLFATVFAGAQEPGSGEQITIETSPQVDERLFLLRVLESMYETWPTDVTDAAEFARSTAELRKTAQKLKAHIADSRLGDELDRLYSEFVEALDAYTWFLGNIEAIEQGAEAQARGDHIESGYSGGFAGGSAYAVLKHNDCSTAEAAGAALAVGALTYVLDAWQKSDDRERLKKRAVEVEARRVQDTITSALLHAQTVSRNLARQHGWERGEAGFELSDQQTQRVAAMIENDDIDGLLRFANAQVAARPRDPMVRLTRNVLASARDAASPAVLIDAARDSVAAASLVPEPAVYDEFRTACVAVGAFLASGARERERMGGVSVYGSSEAGRYAVALWREVLKSKPTDPTGETHEALACSLLAINELAEAIKLMVEIGDVRKTSPEFSYNCSCLMSRAGDADLSLRFLQQAIRLGFSEISHVLRDPDLAYLRERDPRGFEQCTAVKTTWNIVYGFFNDDITLRNNSAFALSNVVFHVRLEQDGRVWTRTLKADVISPGETHTWSNVVSIPGSRLTASKTVISCDQNR